MHSYGAEVHRDFGPVLVAAPVAPALPLEERKRSRPSGRFPPPFASVGLALPPPPLLNGFDRGFRFPVGQDRIGR